MTETLIGLRYARPDHILLLAARCQEAVEYCPNSILGALCRNWMKELEAEMFRRRPRFQPDELISRLRATRTGPDDR